MKKKFKKLEKRVAELERLNNSCKESQLKGEVFFMDVDGNIIYPKTEQKESSKLSEKQVKQIHESVNSIFSDEKKPFSLAGLRVEVGSEENSIKLQEYAFKQGFIWSNFKPTKYKEECKVLMFWSNKTITHDYNLNKTYKSISENKVYNLVHYNDIKHHIEPEKKYFFNRSASNEEIKELLKDIEKDIEIAKLNEMNKDLLKTTKKLNAKNMEGKQEYTIKYPISETDYLLKELLIHEQGSKIEVLISENKFLRKSSEIIDRINKIKTEHTPSDITLKDAITKVYGKKPIGFDKIKLNDFINALNGKTNNQNKNDDTLFVLFSWSYDKSNDMLTRVFMSENRAIKIINQAKKSETRIVSEKEKLTIEEIKKL